MTLSDVAEVTLLSWDTVKAITKTHLARDYGKPALRGVRYLGIDEIHLGSKKRYFTIVIDLEDGGFSGPSRGGVEPPCGASGRACAGPRPRSRRWPPT